MLSTLISQSEERTAARIEDSATALLTEFHKWASPMEQKMRSHAVTSGLPSARFLVWKGRVKPGCSQDWLPHNLVCGVGVASGDDDSGGVDFFGEFVE
jgi:hypothetical protein